MSFKVGEVVYVKKNGSKGTIVRKADRCPKTNRERYIVDINSLRYSSEYFEHELTKYKSLIQKDCSRCTCGAKHTNDKNIHSEWCDINSPPGLPRGYYGDTNDDGF